ncbi:hypothetical protein Tco_1408689 [Tanacetum coccineum]
MFYAPIISEPTPTALRRTTRSGVETYGYKLPKNEIILRRADYPEEYKSRKRISQSSSIDFEDLFLLNYSKKNSLTIASHKRLREELEADVALANNLLDVLTRYLEQMRGRGPEMLRVESLLADPLTSYGLQTLQRTTRNDMRNSSNLVAARNELLRTIAEKEELIRVYRAI